MRAWLAVHDTETTGHAAAVTLEDGTAATAIGEMIVRVDDILPRGPGGSEDWESANDILS